MTKEVQIERYCDNGGGFDLKFSINAELQNCIRII